MSRKSFWKQWGKGSFLEYTRGFERSERGPAVHAMLRVLEAYFDDSADPKKERYCASGGFIGSKYQWDAFIVEWKNQTCELGKPFRSTDCEGGHGQFSNWPKPKRDELMGRLVSVIQKIKLAGFASIVPVQAYRDAFPGCADDAPHLLTIPHAIVNMAYIADRMNIQVQTWFEDGGPTGFTGDTFSKIKKMNWKPSQRLNGISFDSKHLIPLQSADLIAREAFKHIDNLGVREMRIPLRRIGERAFFIAWTGEALRYLAKNGGPENLELLAHWDDRPDAPKMMWHSLWLAKKGKA